MPSSSCVVTTKHRLHTTYIENVDVLLTVHLSIFISVINQLDAQNFCFTVRLVPSRAPVHETATYRFNVTRGCVMQF